jgi:flavodoxin I
MKALIVYDSAYGNTETVARAIAESLGSDAQVRHVRDVGVQDVRQCDLLIVGSPTQAGRPTRPVQEFIESLPSGSLAKVPVAAFDTRVQVTGVLVRLVTAVLGYAAGRIEAALTRKGGLLAGQSRGFIVEGKEGPLKEGEIARAQEWAVNLATAVPVAEPGE